MLTLQKAEDSIAISVSTANQPIENLLTREWLLTNGRGSYSSSTISGCNTRGYHGLLIGSLNPPVNRVMALANCLEMLISRDKVINLSTFEFSDKFAPSGFCFQKRFTRDIGVHFNYEVENISLTKSVYLLRDTDTVALVYDFQNINKPIEFVIRPLVGLRDFHSLQKSYAPLCSEQLEKGLLIRHNSSDGCRLFLSCPGAKFENDKQWWFNFVYRNDKERGQNHTEDLWSPGFFKCRIDSPAKIIFWANLHVCAADFNPEQLIGTDIETVFEDLRKHQEYIIQKGNNSRLFELSDCHEKVRRMHEELSVAADQFIVRKQVNGSYRYSILAGYPWFADWGRDAFISLPGLLLLTGRLEEAYSVLKTFAAAADKGMIPSRFDDNNSTACFNSVDASLWFIIAAFHYLRAGNDIKAFTEELLPTIHWIVDSYRNGTRFDIHADSDGLISAGNEHTQLTWMDAKYDGVAFTPRYGKAVEVNALWYNCLRFLAEFHANNDVEKAQKYESLANQVEKSFCELFWNNTKGYLNDCILPDGSADEILRPNQIFAVSLEFSPLSPNQQQSVVDVIKEKLLTPYGLRTLDPSSDKYKAVYTGPQSERDGAYHQGTVWPYLIGPFIEGYLKINKFSPESKKRASEFLEPLLRHFDEDGCLESISEIFDAEPPHKPKGCFAQAWSVAEVIRANLLING
ncbi:MAG: glycogen debranching enzyme family protein [Sedimentisphaerales bacterium]|nr:glycogen debranching enzyme family protein [Sedimentisphaerales bacterium]